MPINVKLRLYFYLQYKHIFIMSLLILLSHAAVNIAFFLVSGTHFLL